MIQLGNCDATQNRYIILALRNISYEKFLLLVLICIRCGAGTFVGMYVSVTIGDIGDLLSHYFCREEFRTCRKVEMGDRKMEQGRALIWLRA